MLLKYLYVKEYNLLKNFEVEFDNQLSILIGKNGSGKSSILEVFAWIFRSANLTFIEGQEENTPFEFKIQYQIRIEEILEETSTTADIATHYVGVTLEGSRSSKKFWNIATDNSKFSLEELVKRYGYKRLLPTNVVIYYSGWFDTMSFICSEHEKIYSEQLRIRKTASTRDLAVTSEEMFSRINAIPLLYIRKVHFEILLASLFSFEFNEDLDTFFKEKIRAFKSDKTSLSIVIKKRQWKTGADYHSFWGADGLLLQFLLLFRDNSYSKWRYNEDKEQYLFRFDLDGWYKIREFYGEEKKLFYLLHILHVSEMLGGIQLFLSKESTDISHFHLSEGEQQLITIRGISELLLEDNTMLLFDEPDTYLHPSWQRSFIGEIDKLKGNSQYLLATHSPQLLSNFKNGHVLVLEDGKVVPLTPKYYGKDINTILFELMGVKERPREIEERLRKLFRLIDDEKFDDAHKEYAELAAILGESDNELVRAKTLINLLND